MKRRGFPWATLGRLEFEGEFFQKLEEQKARVDVLPRRPIFSLVVLATDRRSAPDLTWESLLLQSYPHWEALVVGPRAAGIELPSDPRFRWIEAEPSANLTALKNLGASQATGDFVGVLSLGDFLSPAALFQLSWEWGRRPEVLGFYTHEIQLEKGKAAFFSKCEWSPFTLAHWNYIGDFWVVRREYVPRWREGENEDQAALLEIAEKGALGLVPYYLYYTHRSRRVAATSRAQNIKSQTLPSLLSAVICFRNKGEMTARCLEKLLACAGETPLEVLLVDNDSDRSELEKLYPYLTQSQSTRLVHHPGPFNYGRMHNWAIQQHTRGDVILLLNNDVLLSLVDLDYWSAWATAPGVATVGCQLRYPDGRVQHAGLRAWYGGEARMARVRNSQGEDGMADRNREVFANTFAACMVQRQALTEVGPLRETDLSNGFGDVAFCFEARRRGWKNIYLGNQIAFHAESASRGQPYEYWEEFGLEREYPEILQQMLRQDLGWNHVPGETPSLWKQALKSLKAYYRRPSRWDALKPALKKGLRTCGIAMDNA